MEGKVVLKKIELELYFDVDFMPPEKFDKPCRENGYRSKCGLCQFYGCDDETAEGYCGLDFGAVDAYEKCPIRKFFERQK